MADQADLPANPVRVRPADKGPGDAYNLEHAKGTRHRRPHGQMVTVVQAPGAPISAVPGATNPNPATADWATS